VRQFVELLDAKLAARKERMRKHGELDLDTYPFTVRKLTPEEGGGYLVEYPDVPLCRSDGETIEEAITDGQDALEASLMCYLQDGKPLPKPSSGQAYSGTFRVRMSKTMHAQIAARAKEEGVSLSLFVVEAAAEAAGRYARQSKSGRPARPNKLRKNLAQKAPMRGKRATPMA
jgi:antitoxin HicB